MCGINGVLLKKEVTCSIYEKIVDMNQQIFHRGPDSRGIYTEATTGIGMQRLSIIDIKGGDQPIFNEKKDKAIVFNGEIYNYKILKEELAALGHHFVSDSDTETILHGYEEYGNEIFKKLRGMFAICIYDINKNELILARDRAGQKPLYYYTDDEKIVFASELKSIVNVWDIKKRINKTALNLFLGLTYIPAPYTIYDGICKLEPGHLLRINKDSIIDEVYWSPHIAYQSVKYTDYEDAKNQLRRYLEEAVRQQMISDVPLGAFLSGGIDSSIIVGIMSKISDKPIETFSIGFREKDFDESDKAETVARYNNTNHHSRILDYGDALIFLNRILDSIDEPFADSSAIPTYFVSEYARQYVTVVLTGDAGDELFGGYSKYLISYYAAIYKRIPHLIRRHIIEPIIYHLPDKNSMMRKIKKVIRNANEESYCQHLNLMNLGIKDIAELLREDFFQKDSFQLIYDKYSDNKCKTELQRSLYTDFSIVLEGDMLTKVDRMSMLNSLETRVPLLDEKVIDLAFSIEDTYKIYGKKQKRILRDTFDDLLPAGIKKQTKQGFGVPVGDWFRGPLKNQLMDFLCEDRINKQNIFKYDYIKGMIDQHMSLKENRSFELWTLFVFQYWYFNYFMKGNEKT